MDACAKCENKLGMIFEKVGVSEEHRFPVLEHSIADASTVAQVLYDKCVMAISL